MTDQQHARVIRNSAGLIIEDVEFEAVESESERCTGCAFDSGNARGCINHACVSKDFPDDHPLHGKRAVWVRKTT